MKLRILILAIIALCHCAQLVAEDAKLKGKVIGTIYSVDYNTGSSSTTVNNRDCAFDGNLDTYFASFDRSKTWVGLDLGKPHVITRVGWSPRNDGLGPGRMVLALFEGSNREDFMDAVPLYLIDEAGVIGQFSYADVNVSKGFRYVRYVGPNNARCNVAELEFYGHAGEGDESQYYQVTNLPTLSIHTVDGVEPYDKEHEINGYISIICNDGKGIQQDTVFTRLRGNASMGFPKKPYRLKFDHKKHMLKDSPDESPAKAKKWTLINNYGDKTLMRNILANEVSRRVGMPYTPWCKPVDVIFNGEYRGCYQLADQININKNRVNITEMDETCTKGDDLTGGYLIEVDAYADQESFWINSSKGNPFCVKSPDEDWITSEQKTYIRNYFNQMETALYSNNFTSATSGYRKYLDLDTFLKHFLVGEFTGNTDTYWSVYMTKDRLDDQFKVGPCWDFDLAFDNDNRTYPISNLSDYIYRTRGSAAGNMRSFVDRIVFSDSKAIAQLQTLWGTLRDFEVITEDNMLDYVDEMAATLDASQRLNFLRWDILNSYVHQNPRVYGSYAGEVDNVKNYIHNRIAWFDRKLKYQKGAGVEDVSRDDVVSRRYYTLGGVEMENPQDGIVIEKVTYSDGTTVSRKVMK